MIKAIKQFLLGDQNLPSGSPKLDKEQELRLATVALLIEAAVMDGHFDEQERQTITDLLIEGFEVDQEEAADLIEAGVEAIDKSIELFTFSRVLKDGFDVDQRVQVIEMLWRVTYADGDVHDYEANLIRRVCGLLHVSDQDSGKARQRVLETLDNTARLP